MYYYAVSDKGSVKEINQDSIVIQKLKIDNGTTCVIGFVCDGMGGLSAGERASYTAASMFVQWFEQQLPSLIGSLNTIKVSFAEFAQSVNAAIYEIGIENGFRIGTTISGVLIIDNTYLTFNVGDSRVYRSRGKAFELLTRDHTYVQKEIDNGNMTEQEAEESGKDHFLTRCLGGYSSLEAVDFTDGTILQGDKFVFCSDGARHVVTPQEYGILFSHIHSSRDLADRLPQVITEVIRRGEQDNISIGCIAM